MVNESLLLKVIHASKWSMLTEISSKVLDPLVFLILAWFLTPNDYGIVSFAVMIISFCGIFWETGLSYALIQQERNVNTAANVVFWTNALIGVSCYVIVLLFAGPIADLLNEPNLASVIQVQGLIIIISALYTVPRALSKRDFNFRLLFKVQILTTLIAQIFITLPLAWLGYGYWSLVTGALVGSLIQLILLWIGCSWRPQMKYDLVIAKKLFSLGSWLILEALLAWMVVWIDSFIVGYFLGSHYIGVYRTGVQFVMMIFSLVTSPLYPLLFSYFSRMQGDLNQLQEGFIKATKIFFLVSIPASFGFFLTAENITNVLFNSNWIDLTPVIAIMGLRAGQAHSWAAIPDVLRSIERTDLNTKLMLVSQIVFIPLFIISIQYGFILFLWTRLLMTIVFIPINMLIAKIYLKVNLFKLINNLKWIVISSFMMSFVVMLIKTVITSDNEFFSLGILVIAGIFSYCLFIIPEWSFIEKLVHMMIRGSIDDNDKNKVVKTNI